jgi:hypothetical protein
MDGPCGNNSGRKRALAVLQVVNGIAPEKSPKGIIFKSLSVMIEKEEKEEKRNTNVQ